MPNSPAPADDITLPAMPESPTHGMNLGERIAHVGGRTNAHGYIEFGSVMAVDALIKQVLRDVPATQVEGFQARYRIPDGEWSSWGHVVCGVKGHEQELRVAPDRASTSRAAVPSLDREALVDLIAEHLSGTYHCGRVWEAWSVGTMSEDDFSDVGESDTPGEIADAILALAAPLLPAAVDVGAAQAETAQAAPVVEPETQSVIDNAAPAAQAAPNHSVACLYDYTLARLGLEDTAQMRLLFWDANGALEFDPATDSPISPSADDSDCERCTSAKVARERAAAQSQGAQHGK